MMTTSSLHFRSPYKHGGGGCKRSKNDTQRMIKKQVDVQEKDVTRCMSNEGNDAADLNDDKSIDMEHGSRW